MTQEKVLAALSNVQEPDLGKDIVTLNMVKDVAVSGSTVSLTVVLNTHGSPYQAKIESSIAAGMAREQVRGLAPPLFAHVLLNAGGVEGSIDGCWGGGHAGKVRFHWLSGVGRDLDEPRFGSRDRRARTDNYGLTRNDRHESGG